MTTTPLVLASGSPRRRELLAQIGLPFQVVVNHAPEILVPGLGPASQAVRLAKHKAQVVAAGLRGGLVLGADTIAVLDGDLLGKPADDDDAARMLRLLGGREHRVVTGLAIVDAATGSGRTTAVESTVRFRPLTEEEVARYVATGEPRDKAGAYAIQGIGAAVVAELDGCFTNVVGLPLCETARLLTDAGLSIVAPSPVCRLPDGAPCPRIRGSGSSPGA